MKTIFQLTLNNSKLLVGTVLITCCCFLTRGQTVKYIVPTKKVEDHMPYTYTLGSGLLKKSTFSLKRVPRDVREYEIQEIEWVMPSIPQGDLNDLFAGKITQEQFLKLYPHGLKSIKHISSLQDLKRKIYFLSGYTKKGERIIMVDTQNDGDLSNDIEVKYDMNNPLLYKNGKVINSNEDLKEFRANLQLFKIDVDDFDGEKIGVHQLCIKFHPYIGSVANPIEDRFHIEVLLWEHREGSVNIENKKYKVAVQNGFLTPAYRQDAKPDFLFSEDKGNDEWESPHTYPNHEAYNIGDVIKVSETNYQISSISNYGDTIVISKMEMEKKDVGYQPNFYAPEISVKDVNGLPYTINKGEYTLLDFWGTWCAPCIKSIPALKEINQKFPELHIVSVAYEDEKDIDKLKQMIESKEMNWTNIVQLKSDQSSNSLIKKFNIDVVPTTILINKEGKIIFTGYGTGDFIQLNQTLDGEFKKISNN